MKKHIGNLIITKDTTIDFTEVTGFLEVNDSVKLDAPALQTIGGNVWVSDSVKLDAPALQTIGGNVWVNDSAKLDAPALQTIGGNLSVYGEAKLEALQTVGGNVWVSDSVKLDAPALQTIGGNLYAYGEAKLEAPALQNKNAGVKPVQQEFLKKGFVFADGILQKKISGKKINNITIYKTQKLASDEINYVVFDGEHYSHGETIEKAKEDLKYKISSRDTTPFKAWKLDDIKSTDELIKSYRVITGACEAGVKDFCSRQGQLKDEYSISEIIKMTKGAFGSKEFEEFFRTRGMVSQ